MTKTAREGENKVKTWETSKWNNSESVCANGLGKWFQWWPSLSQSKLLRKGISEPGDPDRKKDGHELKHRFIHTHRENGSALGEHTQSSGLNLNEGPEWSKRPEAVRVVTVFLSSCPSLFAPHFTPSTHPILHHRSSRSSASSSSPRVAVSLLLTYAIWWTLSPHIPFRSVVAVDIFSMVGLSRKPISGSMSVM